jgi:signal transduction histidine kinase
MKKILALITRSLTIKLTLGILGVSLVGIGLAAALVWGLTSSAFSQFLVDKGLNDFATSATTYYQAHGSWDGIEAAFSSQGLNNFPGQDKQPTGKDPLPPFALVDNHSSLIIASGRLHPGETFSIASANQKVAVVVNGETVGYVVSTGGPPNANPFETQFLARINQALVLGALGAMVAAILLGLFLARTITRPVLDLTAASSAMAKGNLFQQVPVRSSDELGELTRTFNKMSADLERSNQLRRQMTADIAHDLRTPLSVITGYLEGLKDGVLKPTPKRFAAMYEESVFLQRLIEDLRTLSLADAGELSMNYQMVAPADLLERASTFYQHQADQAGVELVMKAEPRLPALRVDAERLQQVLGNLLSNALRYTPPNGRIELRARQAGDSISIDIQDSGSGISAEALPHIFERFYRADDSRSSSGSGLGLAIAKSIVELHGGTISVSSAGADQGSLFSICLPVSV